MFQYNEHEQCLPFELSLDSSLQQSFSSRQFEAFLLRRLLHRGLEQQQQPKPWTCLKPLQKK